MAKAQKTIKVKVFKFDPMVDEKPHYETFQVPYERWMCVKEALEYINFELEGSISYRYSLMHTAPGILVNGSPANLMRMIKEDEKEITIEPLPILPVIKDLVVDLDKIYKIRNRLRLYHQPTRPYPGTGLNPIVIPDVKKTFPVGVERTYSVHACIDCFDCLAVCPMVKDAWGEFAGPYFFVKLVKYGLHPEDRGDRAGTAFREGVFNCPTCGKCEKVCDPTAGGTNIPIPKIVLEELRRRALEEGLELPPGYKDFTDLVLETGSAVPREDKPLIEQLPDVVEVKSPQKEVALFTGCIINNNLQKVGQALINVLKKNKVRVHIPKEQLCCGSHLFRTGQPSIGSNFVHRNTAILEGLGVDTVITLCPEGGKTLKQDYPEVLDRKLEFKVMDVTEFLANEIELDTEKMKELKMTVTFSDPCYLKTWQGISKEPREILKKIPGIKLVEMEKSDACCGAGGGMWFGRKDISNRIAHKKCEYIKDSGAQAVVTTCPYCQLNIEEGLHQIPEKERPKILNIVEILDKAYK